MNVSTPYSEAVDSTLDIAIESINRLAARLQKAGVLNAPVKVDLAVAAILERLTVDEVEAHSASRTARRLVSSYERKLARFTAVVKAERDARAEGRLVLFPQPRKF